MPSLTFDVACSGRLARYVRLWRVCLFRRRSVVVAVSRFSAAYTLRRCERSPLRSTYHASSVLSSYGWSVESHLSDEGGEPANPRHKARSAPLPAPYHRRLLAGAYTHRRRRAKLISTPGFLGFTLGSARPLPASAHWHASTARLAITFTLV